MNDLLCAIQNYRLLESKVKDSWLRNKNRWTYKMVGIVYVRPYRVTASEDFIVEYIKTVLKLN